MIFGKDSLKIEERCLLKPHQVTIVGVSGGADSLCLLDLMQKKGYAIMVAHLDHRLRPQSGAEADQVEKLASQLGVGFVLGKENVSQYAKENSYSLEEAAREMRYRFLFKVAEQYNAQAVAVGHNADDQVETILMHLLRGSGLSGLRGMSLRSLPNPWSENIALVRPLLRTWREEIEAYIQETGLEPALDASNLDTRFYRNRLRHELIPYLEDFNPGVRQRFWQMAEILQEDDELIQELVDKSWRRCVAREGDDYFGFFISNLKGQPTGVQRRIIRRAIQKLRPEMRNLDYAAILRAQVFLNESSLSGEIDLIANLNLILEEDKLWLVDREATIPIEDYPQVAPGTILDLHPPAEVALHAGWKIQAEIDKKTDASLEQIENNLDKNQAWLDLESLKLPLKIRAREKGERFSPLGMGGKSIKIADYMINKKIPHLARSNFPLIISGQKIVWLPGYQIEHKFRVHSNTENILHLHLFQDKDK